MTDITTGIKVALTIMLLAFLYLCAVTFLPMTEAGGEHSKTIVGFLLGTVFATIMGYYWGNSSKGGTPLSPADQAAVEDAKEKAVKVVEEAKKDV